MNTLLISILIFLWFMVVYHHVVYPLLLSHVRKHKRGCQSPEPVAEKELPHIVMLVPAYNEADVIADKIRNAAILDYPSVRFRLVIACDGCTDDTAQIAIDTAGEPENARLNIKILEFNKNRGKVAVLNQIIPKLGTDLIALSDASALLSVDGLKLAAAHFESKNTGVVAATYKLLHPGSAGEARYWQYQTGILKAESLLGSPIGVHGALYFIRRRLFHTLPNDTINDDFVLPMSVVAEGHRAVYEPNIIALELEHATDTMDQKRRIRISAGNLQQLLRLSKLLSPKLGSVAFAFFSGKGLRGLMPLILFTQLLLCIWLAQYSVVFLSIALLQIAAIIIAGLSPKLQKKKIPASLKTVFYLVNGYRCGVIGSIRYLAGLERGRWKRVSPKEANS